jgi:hypothetical protein
MDPGSASENEVEKVVSEVVVAPTHDSRAEAGTDHQ